MNWRISIILFVLAVSACKQEASVNIDVAEASYLIEVDDLKTLIQQPNIKILDFRTKDHYEKEHIMGALNIWRTDIEDTSIPYKGIMASRAQIEKLFGKLGIKSNDSIIIYDDNGLCNASRLWWILQNYDFKKVKLLQGGLNAWKTVNGPVSNDVPEVNETVFKLPENAKMQFHVSKEEVQEALKNNTLIIDTRTADEFSGKRKKKGAAKGGRIPSSIHIDWAEAINYNGDKRMKSLQDLETIYSKLNIKKDDPIILYCHSGVRSAHTTFVLTQILGYKNVKNFDGSWTEWSYFNDLPIKKDSITSIKN